MLTAVSVRGASLENIYMREMRDDLRALIFKDVTFSVTIKVQALVEMSYISVFK